MTKYCPRCNTTKPISDFYNSKQTKDGKYTYCKSCQNAYTKSWADRHPERVKELDRVQKRKMRQDTEYREKEKELNKKWHENNREKKRQRIAEYRKKNKKKIWAQNKLNKAIKSGKIIRPKICPVCGEERKVDGHHHDYDKPLDVILACRSCHMKEHSEYINFDLVDTHTR